MLPILRPLCNYSLSVMLKKRSGDETKPLSGKTYYMSCRPKNVATFTFMDLVESVHHWNIRKGKQLFVGILGFRHASHFVCLFAWLAMGYGSFFVIEKRGVMMMKRRNEFLFGWQVKSSATRVPPRIRNVVHAHRAILRSSGGKKQPLNRLA